MALSIGSKAPDFALSTKDASGVRLVKLSDNFGETNTLLLFFPAAFTSVCTAEMCDLTEGFGTYEGLNTTVFGISGDSPFALEAWANQEKIRIPLLSDYDHSVARAYGVAYDSFLPEANLPLSGVAKRSAFIIDRNGVIQYAESSDNPKQLPNFNAIKKRLKELTLVCRCSRRYARSVTEKVNKPDTIRCRRWRRQESARYRDYQSPSESY